MVRPKPRRRGALLLLCCAPAAVAGLRPLAAAVVPSPAAIAGAGAPAPVALDLRDDDRILVLAPHPDDEVLGTGGVLREASRRRLPLRVVFLTSGDSNEWS